MLFLGILGIFGGVGFLVWFGIAIWVAVVGRDDGIVDARRGRIDEYDPPSFKFGTKFLYDTTYEYQRRKGVREGIKPTVTDAEKMRRKIEAYRETINKPEGTDF